MQKIINDLRYDTAKSEKLTHLPPAAANLIGRKVTGWKDTVLYRTPHGRYFMAGERYAVEGDSWSGGTGIEVLSEEEAKRLVGEYCQPLTYEAIFGPVGEA